MRQPCSVGSGEAGELLAGTAGSPAAVLAVSWPKPRWHPDDARRSEGLPAALAELIAREEAAGRKLALRLFQRAPRPATDRVEALLVAPAEGRSLHVPSLAPAGLAPLVERFLAGERAAAPCPRLLLVCTDGRHDRCCAEHGRRFHDALVAESAARARPLPLAESSHLGGHRFAATCLLLPDGLAHGRLRPADAGPLLDALGGGRPLLARYRGRLGWSEAQQVAEAAVLARHPRARDVCVGAPRAIAGGQAVPVALSVDGEPLALEVRCRSRALATPTSCGGPSETRTRCVVAAVAQARR